MTNLLCGTLMPASILILLCPTWPSASIIVISISSFFVFFILAFLLQQHRQKRRKIAVNLLIPAMVLWIGCVVLSFVCGICGRRLIPMVSSRVEFPLAYLKGIAVDSNGQIYRGIHHYSRPRGYYNFLFLSLTPRFCRYFFSSGISMI